ncbi:MAG: threonine ammonia-lyase, biosynthetic [Gammaproteobacteria bacterium]
MTAAASPDAVYAVARQTPLERAYNLSTRLGRPAWIKREDLQSIFSFKIRGAAHRIAQLVASRSRASGSNSMQGVVAASAGNHAQGVASAAAYHGLSALIVMPRTTPDVKIQAVQKLGATVELVGDSYDQASVAAHQLAKQEHLELVHPFDDTDVIYGQGTVALEILNQHPEPIDAIFIPVGGGGLLAGMVAYIKATRPEIKVIGVEPDDSDCGRRAYQAGHPVDLDEVGLFTDGVAVRRIGSQTFPWILNYCDDMITVSIDQICNSVRDLFEDLRIVAEPAGALATAGMAQWCAQHPDSDGAVVAVCSGANTNFERLGHIVERSSLSPERETLLCIQIPEKSGSFLKLCRDLGDCDVSEFNYRFSHADQAHIFIGVRHLGQSAKSLQKHMEALGYRCSDLSHNELAKGHLRFMVGGRARSVGREMVYRFVFPERPGALLKFLDGLGGRWNITLFHYRNHGAAYARVFVGFDLGASPLSELEKDLARTGYRFHAESANPAYLDFLR